MSISICDSRTSAAVGALLRADVSYCMMTAFALSLLAWGLGAVVGGVVVIAAITAVGFALVGFFALVAHTRGARL